MKCVLFGFVALLGSGCAATHGATPDADAADASRPDAHSLDAWTPPSIDAALQDSGVDGGDVVDEDAGDASPQDAVIDAAADGTSDGGTDGTCVVNPSRIDAIQAALDDPRCTTVVLPDATYDASLDIRRSVTLVAASTGARIVPSAPTAAAIDVTGATSVVVLRGIAVAHPTGRCIRSTDADLTLDAVDVGPCVIDDPNGAAGAGLSARGGRLHAVDSAFHDVSITAVAPSPGRSVVVSGAAMSLSETPALIERVVIDEAQLIVGGWTEQAVGAAIASGGGPLELRGCTIVRASVSGDVQDPFWLTGAVSVFRASVRIEDTSITDVHASIRGPHAPALGLAIAVRDGSLDLQRVSVSAVDATMTADEAGSFAGVVFVQNGVAAIDRLRIVDVDVLASGASVSVVGPGLVLWTVPSARIIDSLFQRITARVAAGAGTARADLVGLGIYVWHSHDVAVRRSTIANTLGTFRPSTAPAPGVVFAQGGAIAAIESDVALENLTLTHLALDASGSSGGALYADFGTLVARHLTVRDAASAEGGAWTVEGGSADVGAVVLDGVGASPCVARFGPELVLADVASDVALDCVAPGIAPVSATGLAAFGDHGGPTPTIDLALGAAVVDALPAAACLGIDGLPLLTDQRGEPRPLGVGCDLGAVEAR